MSVTITRSQAKSEASGFTSNSVGYLNSVWYTFRQVNGTFTAVSAVVLNTTWSTPSTAGIAVGQKIRFAGGPYDGTEVGTVVSFVPNVSITCSGITFLGTGAGEFVNLSLFRNQHIETRLVDAVGNQISKATSAWFTRPNLNGFIDLQSELRSLFYRRELLDYTVPIYEYESAGFFLLQYREVYWQPDGLEVSGVWINVAENCLAAPARKQIKEEYGNNLLDYVLKPAASAVGSDFINGNFNGSLTPWLQNSGGGGGQVWIWGANGSALCNEFGDSIFIYQEVNVAAGNRLLNFTCYAGDEGGGPSTFEVWAFNNPATILSTGTLVSSLVVQEGLSGLFNQSPAFPSAVYVGFRVTTNNQGAYIDNCAFPDAAVLGGTPGKFLERLEEPIIWRGLPSSVSFVLDKNSEALIPALSLRVEWLDINHAFISAATYNYGARTVGGYAAFIEPPPAGVFFASCFAHITGDTSAIVSEVQTFKVRDFCSPAIVLEWQNSLGGYDIHAFLSRQDVSLGSGGSRPIVESYDPDIENSQGNIRRDDEDQSTTLVLYDDYVLTSELFWMHEIKLSRQVRAVFPAGDYIFVVPIQTSTGGSTGTTFTKFSVTIRLPNNFTPQVLDPELIPNKINSWSL